MLAKFFNLVIAKISAVLVWIGDLFKAVFVAAWDLLRDAACWPFEQLLEVAISALGAIDVSSIESELGIFGQIPAGVLEVAAAVGAGTCFSIIGAAIVIRFALQLIPFTRLGS